MRARSSLRTVGRRFGVLLAISVLASVASSCGAGEDDADVLTDAQAADALFTLDNLGEDWIESTDDDDDDASGLGCLEGVASGPAVRAKTEQERGFEMVEAGLPAVVHLVESHSSVATASKGIDRLRNGLEDCQVVESTDDDGTTVRLEVAVDTDKTSDMADEQINLAATGTVNSDGFELPMGLWISVVRIDNHVTLVSYADLDAESGEGPSDHYARVATERLAAVISGEDPNAMLVVRSDSDEAAEGSAPFEQLALDGGSYTWANGVTMTVSIDRIEPWGEKSDFCGDGSCGVADRDDTRVVLRYEVTAPESLSEPFDPSDCPGSLHSTVGNDDEALSGVFGDHYQELGGKVFPGQTKFGLEEYYIEKAYVGGEFYIESTCGDVEYDGESAYFVGVIEAAS